jgi:hypothetical protein
MSIVHEKIGELIGKAQLQMEAEAKMHGLDMMLASISTTDLKTLMVLVESHGKNKVSDYLAIKVDEEYKRRKRNFETPESL